MRKLVLVFVGLLSFIPTSHAGLAGLIDLGNGIIRDTTQNIEWVKDDNIFKALCDANDPIASGFIPVDAPDVASICNIFGSKGAMTWNDAVAWVARLNSENYLGYNDWRLPSTPSIDDSCVAGPADPLGESFGYGCLKSELGHLFSASIPLGLGNPNDLDDNCLPFPPTGSDCFLNTGDFNDTRELVPRFWSTEYDVNKAWSFAVNVGWQYTPNKGDSGLVWPVRTIADVEMVLGECDYVDGINIQDVICIINKVLE